MLSEIGVWGFCWCDGDAGSEQGIGWKLRLVLDLVKDATDGVCDATGDLGDEWVGVEVRLLESKHVEPDVEVVVIGIGQVDGDFHAADDVRCCGVGQSGGMRTWKRVTSTGVRAQSPMNSLDPGTCPASIDC